MKLTIEDTDALRSIEPQAVRAYLTARGWRFVEAYGGNADVYDLDDAPEILAPASAELADYASRMSQIIEILTEVEGRDALKVFGDLSSATTDLIRLRAPEAEQDGSITIDAGVRFIEHSRNLLMAAACATTSPRASYRAGSMRQASDYLDDVRFGQTERGSFVVTLLSPVRPSLIPASRGTTEDLWTDTLAEEPYSRRVTYTLMEALVATREAVTSSIRGAGITAFSERVSKGVSANLCDALAGLIDAGNGVDVSLSLALTRPPRSPLPNTSVRFVHSEHQLLSEAATLFRRSEPRPDERLEGYLIKLSRDQNEVPGTIAIRTTIDGKPRSIAMTLDGENYDEIAKAYDGQSFVAVEGDLKRQGHRWVLENPRNLEIAPSSSEDD